MYGGPRLRRPRAAMALLLTVLVSSSVPAPLRAQVVDSVFVWTQEPSGDPSFTSRNDGCGLWDARRQRMMVIGGGYFSQHTGGSHFYHQNAVVRGSADAAWTFLAGGVPLTEATAVMDSAGDAVWMFGGRQYTSDPNPTSRVLGNLVRFDPASLTWSVVAPLGLAPQPRVGASLSLDAARGRLWLFGGRDTLNQPLGDLWSMDLASPGLWTKWPRLSPSPPARSKHLAVVDPTGDRLIIVGGLGTSSGLGDTWVMSLTQPGVWLDHGTSATTPYGHVIGVLDRSRGRVVACAEGETVVHVLPLDTAIWDPQVPFGTPVIDAGSTAILDPAGDRMVVAWAGGTASTFGGCCTPPTGFLSFHNLEPMVHLEASLTAAHFVVGATELVWDLQFDHPLWIPAVLETTNPDGVSIAIRSVQPEVPGPVSLGLYDPHLAGRSLPLHFRWFDGQADQFTPDVPVGFPPPPLGLHVTPDSLWQTGSDLHVWFSVPDDSARFLAPQTLERSDEGGPWHYRDTGYPNASGIWAFDEIGALPFRHYDYRIAWTGPDGVQRASAPYGRTILAAPQNPDQRVYPDSVILTWTTAPGVDETGMVFIQRPSAPGAWSDSIPWRTDAAGGITVRDTAVVPDQDYVYALRWSDGTQPWDAQGIYLHTPDGTSGPPPAFSLGRASPNPAGDGFDLPLVVPGPADARIEVFDLAGRLRRSASVPAGTTSLHVGTEGLESGVYVVRGRYGSGTQTTRITVMR